MEENVRICDEKYIGKYNLKRNPNHSTLFEFKYFMRKNKNNIKKFSVFTIFGLCYLLYFLSLESCYLGEGLCSSNFKWIKRKVIEEIISCLLLAIILELILFNVISKYHLFHIILLFFFSIIIVMI